MLALQKTDPASLYDRIDLDARVEGSDALNLTRLLIERVVGDIEAAMAAHRRGRREHRIVCLNRACRGLQALIAGIEQANPLAAALFELYNGSWQGVRRSITVCREQELQEIRSNLNDVLTIF